MTDDTDLIPAATVLLVRDGSEGLEVLMLRRNSKIAFGGMWVFPGGKVDDHELIPGDDETSARIAAVREVDEETGLTIDGTQLETWSYWIPPSRSSIRSNAPFRRFSTWFFIGVAPEGAVTIDGGEIHEHQWLTPTRAMNMRREGEIELVPPTWVTLLQLDSHVNVDEAIAWAKATEPEEFRTKPIHNDPMTLAWAGDVAYAEGSHDDDGPRHRLAMQAHDWVYERSA